MDKKICPKCGEKLISIGDANYCPDCNERYLESEPEKRLPKPTEAQRHFYMTQGG